MSNMRKALSEAGFDPSEAEFMVALTKYLNNGGTLDRAKALIGEAAKRMPGEGQEFRAREGHHALAPSRQPDGGAKGQERFARKGQDDGRPAPSTHREREGHGRIADNGHSRSAPAREPSAAQRKAAASVAKKAAASVLDTFKTRDGEAVGDLSVARLLTLAERREKSAWIDAHEAELFRLIASKVGHAPAGAKVRDVLDADELNGLIFKSKDVASMRSRITFTGEAAHA